jgi:hypothetical protein
MSRLPAIYLGLVPGLVLSVLAACSSDPAPPSEDPKDAAGDALPAPDGAGPAEDAAAQADTGANDAALDTGRFDAGVPDARVPDTGALDTGAPEAGACVGTPASKLGETCVGFGKKSPCDAACGEYGYVCFGGGPPNLSDCQEVRTSTLIGNTYCCKTLACVAEPDQDTKCAGAKPKRYQCATGAAGAPLAAPPAGCIEDAPARTSGSNFYCCAQ